jgi:hypothetical protein
LPGKSRTYFELVEAFRQPDCAVCRMVNAALTQHIDMFIYENINNEARREEIRAARGFCSVHATVMAAGYGRMQSIAALQQDVFNDVLREWDKVNPKPAAQLADPRRATTLLLTARLTSLRVKLAFVRKIRSTVHATKEAIRPRRSCLLCDYERGQEVAILQTLADDVLDPDMQEAFERSGGLCLPHFHMLLDAKGLTLERLSKLMEVEYALLRKVKADLDEYVHKQNAAYREEEAGDEAGAPVQATRLTSGRVVHRDGRT